MRKIAVVALVLVNGLLFAWSASKASANGTLSDCCRGRPGQEFCCYDCCVLPSDCSDCQAEG